MGVPPVNPKAHWQYTTGGNYGLHAHLCHILPYAHSTETFHGDQDVHQYRSATTCKFIDIVARRRASARSRFKTTRERAEPLHDDVLARGGVVRRLANLPVSLHDDIRIRNHRCTTTCKSTTYNCCKTLYVQYLHRCASNS